ncbi:MAG: amidohydrolase family protein, partial [Pseudomonadota bacterium]
MIKIYSARKILTMKSSQPTANYVAVRDGLILGAGDLDSLTGWGEYELDDRFSDKVIMPGFVEGHAHTMEGTLWRHTYCGYFDRMDPDGKVWPGIKTKEGVLERLKQAEQEITDPDAPLPGWQLDPIYFDNERITRKDLDQISTSRPIGVLHASGHIMNVNSKALELGGLLKTGLNHPGIPLDAEGLPDGELRGPDVMTPVAVHVGFGRDFLDCDERGLRDFAKLCVRAGVTTVTDLAARLQDEAVEMLLR